MGRTLLVVPDVARVKDLAILGGMNAVILDEMLLSGFAGVYFRRLMVQVALQPDKRDVFEKKRHAYLGRVLKAKAFVGEVLFIGTRATDVDLLEFDAVFAVRVSDSALRAMSRKVFGDPVLLCLDYLNVMAAIEDAVDDWMGLTDWAELPLLIMRKFQNRQEVDTVVGTASQKELLAGILQGEADASAWLEDEVFRAGTEKKPLFLADYDYLSFIRAEWRDAVVRLLGKAPSVVEVFRLPWCVVQTDALNSMCYRPDVTGRPTASARGYSLVRFVQEFVAGNLTSREMLGSWVGGLLCDDLTAVDTIAELGVKKFTTLDTRGAKETSGDGSVCVPVDHAWLYEAVAGISVAEWNGARQLDGAPKIPVGGQLSSQWVWSLPFAELYGSVTGDSLLQAAVVQFMHRLHSVHLDGAFVRRLLVHATNVFSDGCTKGNFDADLTPLLPGYSYLAAFSRTVRVHVVKTLGENPTLSAVVAYAERCDAAAGVVSVGEVCADASRLMLFAGHTLHDLERASVNPPSGSALPKARPGYCYECVFQPRFRARARRILRSYPTLDRVMHWRMIPWYIEGALDKVHVKQGKLLHSGGTATVVLHFELSEGGISLRNYLHAFGYPDRVGRRVKHLRVGQEGVCYSASWYVSSIIAWTIVGCVLFATCSFLAYKRMSSGRGGTGGARRFY